MGCPPAAGMAFVLSCTLSDRIAAVGWSRQLNHGLGWCTGQRPVPVIAFHGAADPIVPYQGGPLGDPFNPRDRDVPCCSGLGGGLGSTKPVRNETRRIRVARTSLVSNTRAVLETRLWCSIPFREAATPGLAASRAAMVGRTHQRSIGRHESDVDVLS